MITNAKDFYASIQGKRVAFCGIGGSNLPLISIFQKKGAVVLACDKRDREKLGETGEKLENQGVELHLGEAYLKNLNADIIFRTPGMPYYLPELVQAGTGRRSHLGNGGVLRPVPLQNLCGHR